MNKRALYFARRDCQFSLLGRDHLKQLGFDLQEVWSSNRGERLPGIALNWQGEYIFCFRSYFILPRMMLDKATVASINFHPGPPHYRGTGCLNYALYNNETDYGVTCHVMTERVDAGPILQWKSFPIEAGDNVASLLAKTHRKLFELFTDVSTGIADRGADYIDELRIASAQHRWRGKAPRAQDLDKLQEVNVDISSEELARRLRAVHTDAYPLKLTLHGYQFRLTLD